MCLMHELKKFVDYCFQELPVRLQESWVLPNNIHNIRCDNGLVVLATLDLAQPKQIFDNSDQKPFFCFLVFELIRI